jgi:hypothetical protein
LKRSKRERSKRANSVTVDAFTTAFKPKTKELVERSSAIKQTFLERNSAIKIQKSAEKPLRLIISAKKNQMLVKAVKIDCKSAKSEDDFSSPTRSSFDNEKSVMEFCVEQRPTAIKIPRDLQLNDEPTTPGLKVSTQALI